MLNLLIIAITSTLVLTQNTTNTTTVYVNAVYQCYLNFNLNNTTNQYLLNNCSYFVTGFSSQITSYTDFTNCYTYCCPGLVQPGNSTINDIQTCVNTYAHQPFPVILIGILIGIFLLFIFIIIPCCFSKDGYYTKIKNYLKECCKRQEQKQEEDFIVSLKLMKSNTRKIKDQEMKNSFLRPTGSMYILRESSNRILINDESVDDIPSQERKCCICKKGKSNLRFHCSHNFHNNCLQAKNLQKCQQCKSDKIYPAAAFCSICEKRYVGIENINIENTYICKLCDEK